MGESDTPETPRRGTIQDYERRMQDRQPGTTLTARQKREAVRLAKIFPPAFQQVGPRQPYGQRLKGTGLSGRPLPKR